MPPDEPDARLGCARESSRRRAERRHRAASNPRLKSLERTYYPQFLVAGSGRGARNGHGDRWRAAGRIERPGADDSKLRPWAYRHLSGDGPVCDSRAGGHAIGGHPGRAGAIRGDRDEPASAIQRRAGHARRRAPRGGQYARRSGRRPRRLSSRPPRATNRAWRRSTMSRRRSGCWSRRRSTMRWPA